MSEEEGLGGELPDPPGGDGEPPVDVGVVGVRRVYEERRVMKCLFRCQRLEDWPRSASFASLLKRGGAREGHDMNCDGRCMLFWQGLLSCDLNWCRIPIRHFFS